MLYKFAHLIYNNCAQPAMMHADSAILCLCMFLDIVCLRLMLMISINDSLPWWIISDTDSFSWWIISDTDMLPMVDYFRC